MTYVVIDIIRSESLDSEYEDFSDALDRAEELALDQAGEEGIDPDTIDTFINGDNPETNPYGSWEAGAGPTNDPCAYWPHVIWR